MPDGQVTMNDVVVTIVPDPENEIPLLTGAEIEYVPMVVTFTLIMTVLLEVIGVLTV